MLFSLTVRLRYASIAAMLVLTTRLIVLSSVENQGPGFRAGQCLYRQLGTGLKRKRERTRSVAQSTSISDFSDLD